MHLSSLVRRAAAPVLWGPVTAALAAAPLPAEVEAALQRAQVPKDSLVALVQEVGSPSSRMAWQPHHPVNPASLMKLLTSAAALELLGPAWNWSTQVWLRGDIEGGVLKGTITVKANGDPKFVPERLWLLMRRLQQMGVKDIQGDIVLDRSAFSVPPHDPAAFDNNAYSPSNVGADALMLNYKSVTYTFRPQPARGVALVSTDVPLAGVKVDATVPLAKGGCDDWRGDLRADFTDPARVRFNGSYAASCGDRQWPAAYGDPKSYNERLIAGMWRELGGTLGGRVRDGAAPSTPPTFELPSPTLAEVVRDMNKFSNNVIAQQVFLTLGLTQRGTGSPDASREVLRQWLTDRYGDAVAGTVIDNGSGLSRDNRLTAQLLARVLQTVWAGASMPELMSSLPVSGIDGTMRRTRNASTGRAHLKTGTLNGTTGIAGYVLSASGRRYVVVGIVTHPNSALARPALEALVQWTAAD